MTILIGSSSSHVTQGGDLHQKDTTMFNEMPDDWDEYEGIETDASTFQSSCKSCGAEVTVHGSGCKGGDQEMYECGSCGREDMNGDDMREQGGDEEETIPW